MVKDKAKKPAQIKPSDRMSGLIRQLAREGMTLGEFANLVEGCTSNRLVVDIRNRNGQVPLKDIDTAAAYPARRIKR